jgi:signal peptidase I
MEGRGAMLPCLLWSKECFVKIVLRSLAVAVLGCIAFTGVMLGLGWRAYVVHTGSMTPNIPSGDLVIDRPAGPVHVGEVITFAKTPGQTVTHRVAAITKDGIETKGDANPTRDFGYVTRSQLVGRVYAAIPYGGFLVVFCSHPEGVIGVVLLMCSIWMAWSLFVEAPGGPWPELSPTNNGTPGVPGLESTR